MFILPCQRCLSAWLTVTGLGSWVLWLEYLLETCTLVLQVASHCRLLDCHSQILTFVVNSHCQCYLYTWCSVWDLRLRSWFKISVNWNLLESNCLQLEPYRIRLVIDLILMTRLPGVSMVMNFRLVSNDNLLDTWQQWLAYICGNSITYLGVWRKSCYKK